MHTVEPQLKSSSHPANSSRASFPYRYLLLSIGPPLFLWGAMLVAPSQSTIWAWLVVFFILATLVVKPTPYHATWVLIAYVFSVGGSDLATGNEYFQGIPGWVAWLTYPSIFLILGFTIVLRHRRLFFWSDRRLIFPIVFLFGVSLVGSLLNGSGPLNWIGWLLHYLRYPILAIALLNSPIGPNHYRHLTSAFLVAVVIQVPTTFVQAIALRQVGDRIVGTVYGGLTGLMGLAVAMGFFVLLSLALTRRRSIFVVGASFGILIPLFLGAAGFSLVISLLLSVYLIVRWGINTKSTQTQRIVLRIRPKMVILAILGISAIVSVGWYLTTFSHGMAELADWLQSEKPTLTSYRAFVDPSFAGSRSRQRFIATTLQWYLNNPAQIVFGSIGPNMSLGEQGRVLAEMTGSTRLLPPLGTINVVVGLPASAIQFVVSLPRILLEVGLVGLLGFVALFLPPLWVAVRIYRSPLSDPRLAAHALAFHAIWLLYVVFGAFYVDIWRHDLPSLGFWLWTAMLYDAQRRRQPRVD